MNFNYRLSGGQYVLYDGDMPTTAPVDEIAIAFDKSSGTRHKLGNPKRVAEWLAKTQTKYRIAGFSEMADDLIQITGRFPLDELNRCLDNSNYVGRLYEKLLRGEVQALPLDWTPGATPAAIPVVDVVPAADNEPGLDEAEEHGGAAPISAFQRFRA